MSYLLGKKVIAFLGFIKLPYAVVTVLDRIESVDFTDEGFPIPVIRYVISLDIDGSIFEKESEDLIIFLENFSQEEIKTKLDELTRVANNTLEEIKKDEKRISKLEKYEKALLELQQDLGISRDEAIKAYKSLNKKKSKKDNE